ncbi:hypothetical protein [Streptomyces viridosporus]|uniref:hypothetical protein n=1 Tax=Streptomyces viridosporus TaxID=67581 RepID=UPI003700CF46
MTTTRAPGVVAEVIAVRPGPPLAGSVTVYGSKNAALPLLAAAAALGRPVRLSNIPANTDVQIMLSLLQQAGWHVAQPVGEPAHAPRPAADRPYPGLVLPGARPARPARGSPAAVAGRLPDRRARDGPALQGVRGVRRPEHRGRHRIPR